MVGKIIEFTNLLEAMLMHFHRENNWQRLSFSKPILGGRLSDARVV